MEHGFQEHSLSLGLLGLNYKSAPLQVREQASRTLKKNAWKITDARARGLIEGAVVVNTCNRAEILFSSLSERLSDVSSFFRENIFESTGSDNGSSSLLTSDASWYLLNDEQVVPHLYRVATGLDSMIPGEAQILGQLKQAYQRSVEEGLAESLLHRVCQGAFRTAKLVRTSTGIGRGTLSVASVARKTIESIFGDISPLHILIIGAGETGTLVARHLKTHGGKNFFIANRNVQRSGHLAGLIQGVSIPLSRISEVLPLVDVVVSTIDGSEDGSFLLGFDDFASVIEKERSKTLAVLDLSVPRSLDPLIADLPSVYLFDIDDFSSVLTENLDARLQEAEKADLIIEEEVLRYTQWRKERERRHAREQIIDRFKTVSSNEWRRTSRKIKKLNLPPEIEASIPDIIFSHEQSLLNKLFHPFFKRMRGEMNEDQVAFLNELFNLSELSEDDPLTLSFKKKGNE